MIERASGGADIEAPAVPADAGFDDDLQFALYLADEPHYSQVPGFDASREWDPPLLELRRLLVQRFDDALRDAVGPPCAESVREAVLRIVADDSGPSISRHTERHSTLAQMRDFVVHRSPYQLKEADPHTFAIPRLQGRAKQILVRIQSGEYGADEPDRVMHAELFAQTMSALGLDPTPHAYLDRVPASSLMVSNLISAFGLERRRRGALIGHLAVLEMTSVEPMGRYSRALERLGAPAAARRFYDVHVLADAEHEVLALEMATLLAEDEPHLADDIVFGAACVGVVERRFAEDLLSSWAVAPTGGVARTAADG